MGLFKKNKIEEVIYTFEELKKDMVFSDHYAFYRYGDLTRDDSHIHGRLTIIDLDLLFEKGWKLLSHCKDNYLNGINEYLFEKIQNETKNKS